MFDIDFVSSPSNSPVSLNGSLPSLPFVHLSKDGAMLAKGTVQMLGKALGTKHGALAVDSCVADFYEAYISLINPSVAGPTAGAAYVEWLHAWIGYLALASEVSPYLSGWKTFSYDLLHSCICFQLLVGVFEMHRALSVESNNTPKSERKRRRALKSLSQSVLPILTSSHFWNLPTSFEFRTNPSSMGSEDSGTSATALYGNVTLVCLLLQMIEKLVGLLQEDCEAFLPSILYPLVEKAGLWSAPLVQTTASEVLRAVAKACMDDGISRFLQNHMDYLASSMLGKLRIAGGKVVPDYRDSMEIMAVCNSVRYLLQTMTQRAAPGGSNGSLERYSVSNMVEIVSALAQRFNHLIVRKAIGYDSLFDFVLVCSSTFLYMLAGYGADREFLYSYRMGKIASPLPQVWQGGLDQFRINAGAVSSETFRLGDRNEAANDDSGQSAGTSKFLGVTGREIGFVSQLMSRCCYFLSHESLKMRIASTDALIGGFKFLAFVAWHEEVSLYLQSPPYPFLLILVALTLATLTTPGGRLWQRRKSGKDVHSATGCGIVASCQCSPHDDFR